MDKKKTPKEARKRKGKRCKKLLLLNKRRKNLPKKKESPQRNPKGQKTLGVTRPLSASSRALEKKDGETMKNGRGEEYDTERKRGLERL